MVIKIIQLVIHLKYQLRCISITNDSLRQEGQNFKPKTDNSMTSKNWGFPKGGNSYLGTRIRGWKHGNGVSVV